MRYPASEKLEIIRLVEQSHLPVRRTLEKLGIQPARFYRWYDRLQTGGPEALEDKASRPDCQDFCVRRFPSCAHEALFKHDGKLRLCLSPLARRSFPIRSGVVENQI